MTTTEPGERSQASAPATWLSLPTPAPDASFIPILGVRTVNSPQWQYRTFSDGRVAVYYPITTTDEQGQVQTILPPEMTNGASQVASATGSFTEPRTTSYRDPGTCATTLGQLTYYASCPYASTESPTGRSTAALSTAAVTGIAVGATSAFLAVAAGAYVFWRRRRGLRRSPAVAEMLGDTPESVIVHAKTEMHTDARHEVNGQEAGRMEIDGVMRPEKHELEDKHGSSVARDRERRSELPGRTE